MGGFGTIWTGSVVRKLCEDTGGRVFLLHSRFMSDMPLLNNTITCDNGSIVGKGVKVENDNFISQLTVTVSPISSILGDNIVCAQSHNETTVIANTTLELQNIIGKINVIIGSHISETNIYMHAYRWCIHS